MVWEKGVKNTTPAGQLEEAFSKIGKVANVETGFGEFAFVEFADDGDAAKAISEMDKAIIPNVGQVHGARCTNKGYHAALAKKDMRSKAAEFHGRGSRKEASASPLRGDCRRGSRTRSRSRSRTGRFAGSRCLCSQSRTRSGFAASDARVDAMIWVGRVKTTTPGTLLQQALASVGPIVKVETGFGGFAFVEFVEVESVAKAIEMMDGKTIPAIGEIRVSKVSERGYLRALDNRNKQISRTHQFVHWFASPLEPSVRSRRPNASWSRSTSHSNRRSRSLSRRRRRQSRARSGAARKTGARLTEQKHIVSSDDRVIAAMRVAIEECKKKMHNE